MSVFLTGLLVAATLPQDPVQLPTQDPWSRMDEELALWADKQRETPPAEISAYVQTSFFHSILDGDGGTAGFGVDTARFALGGVLVDGFSYRVEGDFAGAGAGEVSDGDPNTDDPDYTAGFGTFEIKDAYLRSSIKDNFDVTVGNFRLPALRSALIDANRLLFPSRTHAGTQLAERDLGVMVEGRWDILRGYLSIHNGEDGRGDKMIVGGRVEVDIAGKGVSAVEGALGAPEALAMTVGGAIFEDDSIEEDGRIITADFALTYDRLAVAAEVADFGDGFGPEYGMRANRGLGARRTLTDTRPRSFMISYMAVPEEWELAWRVDYLDEGNDSNRNIQNFGVNHYIEGHDLKWNFGVLVDELDGEDDTFLTAGLLASF